MRKLLKCLLLATAFTLALLPGKLKIGFFTSDNRYLTMGYSITSGGNAMAETQVKNAFPNCSYAMVNIGDFTNNDREIVFHIKNTSNKALQIHIEEIVVQYGYLNILQLNNGELADAVVGYDPEGFYLEDGILNKDLDGEEASFSLLYSPKSIICRLALITGVVWVLLIVLFGVVLGVMSSKRAFPVKLRDQPMLKKLRSYPVAIRYGKNLAAGIVLIAIVFTVYDAFAIRSMVGKEEIGTWMITGAIITSYLCSLPDGNCRKKQKLVRLIAVCLVLAASALSVFYITSYFTVDEQRAINEQINLENDILRHWSYYQNSHTNYLIMGVFFSLLPKWLTICQTITMQQFAKLAHWLIGVILLHGFIVYTVGKHCRNKNHQVFFALCLYLTVFLNPPLAISLCNYNYDLFSCIFGLISTVLMCDAITENSVKLATAAVLSSVLGMQEKILVFPVMLLSFIIWGYVLLKNSKRKGVLYHLAAGFCPLLLSFFAWCIGTWIVQSVLRQGDVFSHTNWEYFPLWYTQISFLTKILDHLSLELTLLHKSVLSIILTVLFTGFCAILLSRLGSIRFVKYKQTISRVLGLLIGVYLLIGIIYGWVKDSTIIIGSRFVEYICVHAWDFVRSMPSVLLAAGFVLIFLVMKKQRRVSLLGLCALFLLTWGISILYAVMGEYNEVRYQNLYILAYTYFLVMTLLETVEQEGDGLARLFDHRIKARTAMICVLLLSVLSIAEMSDGLRFGYMVSYPLWFRTSCQDAYLDDPQTHGWGTLRASYGNMIVEYCKENGLDLNTAQMITGYHGVWQKNDYGISVSTFPNKGAITESMLTENTFWCVERFVYYKREALGKGIVFPVDEIEPLFVIKHHGQVVSWVWRGDQLRAFWGFEQTQE